MQIRLRVLKRVRGSSAAVANLATVAAEAGQTASTERKVLQTWLQEDPDAADEAVVVARPHLDDAGGVAW